MRGNTQTARWRPSILSKLASKVSKHAGDFTLVIVLGAYVRKFSGVSLDPLGKHIMKYLPDHYLEKYSEELNDSLDLYQQNGEVAKHVLDALHLELVGLFKKNVEYFARNGPIAPK